jgi:hypothetical protein
MHVASNPDSEESEDRYTGPRQFRCLGFRTAPSQGVSAIKEFH